MLGEASESDWLPGKVPDPQASCHLGPSAWVAGCGSSTPPHPLASHEIYSRGSEQVRWARMNQLIAAGTPGTRTAQDAPQSHKGWYLSLEPLAWAQLQAFLGQIISLCLSLPTCSMGMIRVLLYNINEMSLQVRVMGVSALHSTSHTGSLKGASIGRGLNPWSEN